MALGVESDGKAMLLVAVTKELSQKVPAKALLDELNKTFGGRGGGKPDLAQAGGGDPARLDEALALSRAPLNRACNAGPLQTTETPDTLNSRGSNESSPAWCGATWCVWTGLFRPELLRFNGRFRRSLRRSPRRLAGRGHRRR